MRSGARRTGSRARCRRRSSSSSAAPRENWPRRALQARAPPAPPGPPRRLPAPELPWHAPRDRLAHLASSLGIAVGTLGKIARDISLLAQTEVGEAHEVSA